MADHKEQDCQSLMLHTEAVRMMRDDPSLIGRALEILERWSSMETKPYPLFDEWKRILLERDWGAALSTGDSGNQIRQASPISCVLPNKVRLEIIKSCKKKTLNI